MSGIIWLASYPKSGNTWLRVFLTNLRREQTESADINKLNSTPIASARVIFDDEVGIEASDLTADEIDCLRPEVYTQLAANTEETLFMKVHDAYILADGKTPLFPKAASIGVIYIIRNPLDVAVSSAHHSGLDYDQVILNMADETHALCGKQERLYVQLRQRLLSWSGHVLSWIKISGFNICILRYEDMQQRPLETFERAVRFAGLDYGRDEIQKAIDSSSFEELRRQEEKGGFKERSSCSEFFFRKGKAGTWKEELTGEQAGQIIRDHGKVMRMYGYLDEKGVVSFAEE